MAFDSRAYRILIASPSDVEEEREIAVRVIQEWNDLSSYSRKVVLLPLRWETHTAPEYGTRPQEVINRALVDQCDLLVGVFWTRIGTPTGVADSGTLEEIARVAKAGKPIMLYFSKVGADPDKIDLAQLTKLKAFKEETYPNALTESFKSQIEFRDKFAKQLELKVRDLQRLDNPSQPPPLSLGFALSDLRHVEGSSASRRLEIPEVVDDGSLASLPDKTKAQVRIEIATRLTRAATVPVVLAVTNAGSSGIRNLFVEMSVRSSVNDVTVQDYPPGSLPAALPASLSSWVFTREFSLRSKRRGGFELNPDLAQEGLTKAEDGWHFSFEWVALQPQRVRLVEPQLFIKSTKDASVEFTAKVFADSFAEPLMLNATLDIVVRAKRTTLADLIPNLKSLLEEQPDDATDKTAEDFPGQPSGV